MTPARVDAARARLRDLYDRPDTTPFLRDIRTLDAAYAALLAPEARAVEVEAEEALSNAADILGGECYDEAAEQCRKALAILVSRRTPTSPSNPEKS